MSEEENRITQTIPVLFRGKTSSVAQYEHVLKAIEEDSLLIKTVEDLGGWENVSKIVITDGVINFVTTTK